MKNNNAFLPFFIMCFVAIASVEAVAAEDAEASACCLTMDGNTWISENIMPENAGDLAVGGLFSNAGDMTFSDTIFFKSASTGDTGFRFRTPDSHQSTKKSKTHWFIAYNPITDSRSCRSHSRPIG